jgi:hypothetical protein
MATIVFPETFSGQETLYAAIKAKHTADGTKSVLPPYLTENKIDFTKIDAALPLAKTSLQTRNALKETASKNTELRDLTFGPVYATFKNGVQSLKKIYNKAPRKLADWGINIDNKDKIVYPNNFIDQKDLVKSFYTYHNSLAAGTSPLLPFLTNNSVDVSKELLAITTAEGYHSNSKPIAENSEKETENFNNIWQPHVKSLQGIGSYLMSLFPNSPRKITDWGFAIDESETKPKDVKSKLKLGETVTIKSLVIGGTFKNTGSTDLHIYKGTSTKGNPIIVKPGDSWGILKGHSVITVSNPDALQNAEFTALRKN